jgi:hypothetical protein
MAPVMCQSPTPMQTASGELQCSLRRCMEADRMLCLGRGVAVRLSAVAPPQAAHLGYPVPTRMAVQRSPNCRLGLGTPHCQSPASKASQDCSEMQPCALSVVTFWARSRSVSERGQPSAAAKPQLSSSAVSKGQPSFELQPRLCPCSMLGQIASGRACGHTACCQAAAGLKGRLPGSEEQEPRRQDQAVRACCR